MSNKCPKCGSGNLVLLAVFRNDLRDKYRCSDCGCDFVYPPFTLFDQITASPEVLAKFLVFHNRIYKGRTKYHSAVVGGEFDSYEEAITATVARLKEVCVEQNAVDYTQARLSKVDYTQKEVAE